jgi:hypothetical protein
MTTASVSTVPSATPKKHHHSIQFTWFFWFFPKQLPTDRAPPSKYIQTPIFDAAFGARPGGLNLNHAWVGRDDVTELTFRGWDHLKQVFSSNWVKTKVGPDGPLFADFETTMALLATEEPVPLPYEMKPTADDGFATVATYFLATPDNERHGGAVQDKVQTLLVRALSENTRQEVYKVEVNVGITSSQFDLNAYFWGGNNPQYCLVYKLFMKSAASVPYVRKAQARFESLARDALDFSTSFIVFGKEALVLDHGRDIGVCTSMLPKVFGINNLSNRRLLV